ncbi:MAG: hypothetical protein ACYS30_10365 [Planctomycetota bacterium]|jgi:hypothetical protein
MVVCRQAANFGLRGPVAALFYPFSVSSINNDNVSISALVSRLGFGLANPFFVGETSTFEDLANG